MTVEDVLRDFAGLQERYADQGASDTEPDLVAQTYLACALGVVDYNCALPSSWQDWDLYEGEDADDAASSLTTGLREAERRLKALLSEDPRGTVRELRRRLWRVVR